MITGRVYKALQGYLPISDRVIMAKFEGKPANIIILQLYAPTNDHSDGKIEEFYANVKEECKERRYPCSDGRYECKSWQREIW